jgi:hypothetical protein
MSSQKPCQFAAGSPFQKEKFSLYKSIVYGGGAFNLGRIPNVSVNLCLDFEYEHNFNASTAYVIGYNI